MLRWNQINKDCMHCHKYNRFHQYHHHDANCNFSVKVIKARTWWCKEEREREGTRRDLTWKHLASRKFIQPWKLPENIFKLENYQKIYSNLKIARKHIWAFTMQTLFTNCLQVIWLCQCWSWNSTPKRHPISMNPKRHPIFIINPKRHPIGQ